METEVAKKNDADAFGDTERIDRDRDHSCEIHDRDNKKKDEEINMAVERKKQEVVRQDDQHQEKKRDEKRTCERCLIRITDEDVYTINEFVENHRPGDM